jgi:hypothetical protein
MEANAQGTCDSPFFQLERFNGQAFISAKFIQLQVRVQGTSLHTRHKVIQHVPFFLALNSR